MVPEDCTLASAMSPPVPGVQCLNLFDQVQPGNCVGRGPLLCHWILKEWSSWEVWRTVAARIPGNMARASIWIDCPDILFEDV